MIELLFITLALAGLPFVGKLLFPHEISWAEVALNLVVVTVLVSVAYQTSKYAQARDVEVWNGQVLSKAKVKVSCSHSYSCPPCTESCSGSGSSRSCIKTCSTCYDHPYDFDWVLNTSIGKKHINRVDRQGVTEPPRFTVAQIGDPVAQTHSYINLIKAAPESLFNTVAEKSIREKFPHANLPYPSKVYDYHYIDRVLTAGFELFEKGQWNRHLAQSLRELGPTNEVNLVLVMTSDKDPQFAHALRSFWLGGKKNDVVVVLGVDQFPAISWVQVFSWSKEEVFKVQLRDALLELKTASPEAVFATTSHHIAQGFKRRDLKDFDYLKGEIDAPLWLILTLLALGSILSLGLSMFFARNEVL